MPSLKDFMRMQRAVEGVGTGGAAAVQRHEPAMALEAVRGLNFYVETYGCQMNTADSEIVTAVLTGAGLVGAHDERSADVVTHTHTHTHTHTFIQLTHTHTHTFIQVCRRRAAQHLRHT